MTIKSLFKKRQSLYYKSLLKYSQYIFNDHFSLILFFMIGAGGYAYSNYLETLSYGNMWPTVILLFVYFFLAITGRVTLIVEEADQLYLLAKEEAFYPILKEAVFKSYLQSLIPLALITWLTLPMLAQTVGTTTNEGWLILFTLAGLKWLNLLIKIYPYFFQRDQRYQRSQVFVYLLTASALLGLNFISVTGTAVFVLALGIISLYLFFAEKIYFNHALQWEAMIEMEEARLHKLYRFIELFTDVPHMEASISRLSILDRLLESLSKRRPKASYYYLLRMVARNSEYRGLVFRLTIIGGILIYAMDSYLLTILFTFLFIYILGFQLIALVKELEKVPQFQFYPLTTKDKVDSSLYLIFQLLLLMVVVFTVSATSKLGIIGLTVLPIGLLAAYLFSQYYVPFRLQE